MTVKTALVTGASRGIGRAIAQRLAAEGTLVAVHYAENETAAAEVVDAIKADGGRAFAVRANFAEPGAVDRLLVGLDAGLLEHTGDTTLDILVNNAAVGMPVGVATLTTEQFDTVFTVNVKAPLFLIQQAQSRLRDGGRIINISSGVTRIAMPEQLAYAMTKGALDVLTRTLAKEFGPRGITVNSVSPGFVDTDANASWLRDNAEAQTYAAGFSALGRVGQPEDIAEAVAFLAGHGGRWVTGHLLDTTGGSQL